MNVKHAKQLHGKKIIQTDYVASGRNKSKHISRYTSHILSVWLRIFQKRLKIQIIHRYIFVVKYQYQTHLDIISAIFDCLVVATFK